MRVIPFILFYFLVNQVQCYRILGLFVYPGKSHFAVYEPLLKALAQRGHDVTVVSYFPQEEKIPNYTDVSITSATFNFIGEIDFGYFDGSPLKTLATILHLTKVSKLACEEQLESKEVQNLLKSDQKFDLIISEFFVSDCLLGFVHKFKAPLVGLSTSGTMWPWTYEIFGSPSNPSYIYNHLYTGTGLFAFFERVYNTFLHLYTLAAYKLLVVPNDNAALKKYFGADVPTVEEIYMNSSLVLVNSHFSVSQPIPTVPAIIEVSGVHLSKNKRLPPVNIEKWINESTDGVIYFSMGSMIKGHTFPEEKREMFLRVFERLPQRILWKWENESLPGKPDNVMIQRWMPQFDILCHPNVKVFISHGGMLGTTEAVHCGVPVLIMPQFGDQFTNARALESSGGGLIFDFWGGNADSLYNTLQKLLDPSFKKQAEQLSARFKDRPLPPLETAIYWVEYVARHGGAHHMRTAAVGMPLYKYLLLDVIAFLAVVLLTFLWITYACAKLIIRKLVRRSTKVKTN